MNCYSYYYISKIHVKKKRNWNILSSTINDSNYLIRRCRSWLLLLLFLLIWRLLPTVVVKVDVVVVDAKSTLTFRLIDDHSMARRRSHGGRGMSHIYPAFVSPRRALSKKHHQEQRILTLDSSSANGNEASEFHNEVAAKISSQDVTAYRIEHEHNHNNKVVYRFRGIVETGYGRGGKKLGFPTANLGPAHFFDVALTNITTGVYFGYAIIEQDNIDDDDVSAGTITTIGMANVYKAVVNIGYSPTFVGQENKLKIIEAHLMHPIPSNDFYNTKMRLQLVGYIRPEMKFSSLPNLIHQITTDIDTANQLLSMEPYLISSFQDPFFVIDNNQDQPWIGNGGGNATASFEIVVAK